MNFCSACKTEYEHDQEHVCPASFAAGAQPASVVHDQQAAWGATPGAAGAVPPAPQPFPGPQGFPNQHQGPPPQGFPNPAQAPIPQGIPNQQQASLPQGAPHPQLSPEPKGVPYQHPAGIAGGLPSQPAPNPQAGPPPGGHSGLHPQLSPEPQGTAYQHPAALSGGFPNQPTGQPTPQAFVSSQPMPTMQPSSPQPMPTMQPSSPQPMPTMQPSSPQPMPAMQPSSPQPMPTMQPSSPQPMPAMQPSSPQFSTNGSEPAMHASVSLVNPQSESSGAELLEETLDMRFHVEKPLDPNIGQMIADRYCIKSMVGRGGMGIVYRAEQVTIERTVAIKMLHPHIVADADTIKRFQKEAQAISRVEHPHSVRIYDFGISNQGQPFLVMDFIDGVSLRHILKKDGPIAISRAGEIIQQVIEALSCAHSAGIIHRDMKPENIMLCEKSGREDYVYVVDFGISTLAASEPRGYASTGGQKHSDTIGSPPYMSPEQCTKDAEIDSRSDVYSLGIVVFEMLTGRLPFNARGTFEMLEAHLNVQPMSLTSASTAMASCEAIAHVLAKALEKNPDKRFQSVDQFGEELLEALKRDSIRSNYLKNRKESLLTSSASVPVYQTPQQQNSGEQPAYPAEAPSSVGKTSSASIPILEKLQSIGDSVKKDGFSIQTVIDAISGEKEKEEEEEAGQPGQPVPDRKLIFDNCPHCNEPVERGIAFCLGCGRSLASTHEFAKMRAAQGVFTLPRSADTLSTQVPVFSPKARTGGSGLLNPLNIMIVVFALLLIIAICVFFFLSKH